MKIIDLLNKIADGEIEHGYKFRYRNLIVTISFLIDNYLFLEILNDEVEIIEENNKIEHIGKIYDITDFKNDYSEAAQLLKDITDKQCEIIDKLNEMSDKI